MPAMERFRTKYPGVYYVEGKGIGSRKKERIYYVMYRNDGRLVEEKAGRQFQDSMTPYRAARIRNELILGQRLSQRKVRQNKAVEEVQDERIDKRAQRESKNRTLTEEKWLKFMETANDGFVIYDSELRLLEINDAALKMLPPGTKREEIIGKKASEILPGIDRTDLVKTFLRVLNTGEPFVYDIHYAPYEFRKDARTNLKVFKVGDDLGLIVTDITSYKQKEKELRKRESQLALKNIKLEEANIALKVLLRRREEDKEELEEKVVLNIKELVMPLIEKLKMSRLNEDQGAYVDALESNLNEIASPLARSLSSRYLDLTPAEIQVANLVKQGRTSKEAATLLNLSSQTVDFYRKAIRKKLGIKNKKANLRTHLLSIQD